MLALVTVVFVSQGDRVTRLLGLAVPIYFIVMTSMHHEVHTVVVSELELRERNEEATEHVREANIRLAKQALRDDLTGLPEPGRVRRSARTGRVGRAPRRHHDRRPLLRPRPLQVRQRLARPPHRRRAPRRGRESGAVGAAQSRHARPPGRRRVHDAARPAARRCRSGDDRAAGRRRVRGRRSSCRAGASTRPRASASRRTSTPTTTPTRCSPTPTRRSTAPSSGGGTASRSSTSSSARRSNGGSRTSRSSATRSPTTRSSPGTSRRSSCAPDASSARRHWLAGRTPTECGKRRPSCRSRKKPVSCSRSTARSARNATEARAGLAAIGITGDFRIWCNVSANQLTRARPTERLAGLLERTGCDPNQIGIEITETAILPDVEAAAREIADAREARHQGRARRLRHRTLFADAAAAAPDRQGQDRPDLRRRARDATRASSRSCAA